VKNWDREPGESEYSTVQLIDATNAMKSLVVVR
jgi:hypothetical protein